jgi:hypothetical protein
MKIIKFIEVDFNIKYREKREKHMLSHYSITLNIYSNQKVDITSRNNASLNNSVEYYSELDIKFH